VLVDDSPEDLKYAERLTRDGLDCRALVPPGTAEELQAQIGKLASEGRCDVVLVDYRLDAEVDPHTHERRRYRGGSVAAELKEWEPDTPVVLVTTEQWVREYLEGNPTVRRLFDHQILKDRLASRSERPTVVLEIVELARGFRRIARAGGKGWGRVAQLLAAEGEEEEGLEGLALLNAPSATAEIAQFILGGLVRFPGLLLDEHDAAAVLGVTVFSFQRPEVQQALGSTRYEGVFSAWHARWWRGRTHRWLTLAGGANGGREGDWRARAVAAAAGKSLRSVRPARCTWCDGLDVSRACSLCHEPVDVMHSLVAVVDDRPAWTDDAIVCYRCVAEGRAENVRFQAGVGSVRAALKDGELTAGASD
jgi:hypothetical protein